MKRLIVVLLLVLFPLSYVEADPNTTGSSGTFTHKGTAQVFGTGFGVKSPAAPFKYDNFEGGTVGQRVTNGWYTYTQTGGYYPIYSTTNIRYSGTKSAHQRFSGCGTYACNTSYLGINQNLEANTLYVSGQFNYQTAIPSMSAYRNAKLMTFERESTNWQSRVDIDINGTAQLYSYLGCAQASDVDDYFSGSAAMQNNTSWHRVESTIVITDGTDDWRDYKVDNQLLAYVTGDFGDSSCLIDLLLLGHYIDSDLSTNETTNRYWDEIYVDTTQARVELGNAPTWEACTQKEIQIPSAWDDDEITVTVNAGPLTPGSTWYLYVVNSDGVADPTGYPVVIGGTATPTPTPTATPTPTPTPTPTIPPPVLRTVISSGIISE